MYSKNGYDNRDKFTGATNKLRAMFCCVMPAYSNILRDSSWSSWKAIGSICNVKKDHEMLANDLQQFAQFKK